MVKYNRYPAMDENNNFPPVVREALAHSPEQAAVIKESVQPFVAKAISEDRTVADAAGFAAQSAVSEKMKSEGIVTGRTTYLPVGSGDKMSGSAFRHMTESGYWLPLGYTADGHLDAHAIKIWSEDLGTPVKVDTHPHYARVVVTEKDELLMAIRWDGGIEIPGFKAPESAAPAKMPLYQHAPYHPGSDVLPAFADPKKWTGWGSSSMGGINTQIKARASELGASYYSGGVGGEASMHIAARLGSVPARLTFPTNRMPASGSLVVQTSNLDASTSLKAYTGWITDENGNQIHGTVSSTATEVSFARTSPGSEAIIPPDSKFIPEEGPKHRGDTAFLWMGKNNINSPDRVIAETDASYEFFAPLVKRVIVMGHFMNGNQPAVSTTRTNLLRVNATHKARYGATYFDVQDYLTSAEVWADSGLTPTEEDLAQQAIGNKPPSISVDTGHLNDKGYLIVSNRLKKHVQALGWY